MSCGLQAVGSLGEQVDYPDENNDVQVNRKMEEDPNGSHDFLTLVGLVSYYGDEDD